MNKIIVTCATPCLAHPETISKQNIFRSWNFWHHHASKMPRDFKLTILTHPVPKNIAIIYRTDLELQNECFWLVDAVLQQPHDIYR